MALIVRGSALMPFMFDMDIAYRYIDVKEETY